LDGAWGVKNKTILTLMILNTKRGQGAEKSQKWHRLGTHYAAITPSYFLEK
jgi:hypothetical protein